LNSSCLSIPSAGITDKYYHAQLLFVFLVVAILIEVRWNLSIVLICISSIAKDVENFFMYLLAVCTSFENCPVLLHYLIGLFVLLVFNFLSSL
jgi:hypothetical protein